MLSVNADLTAAQVKYILEATADKIGTGQHRIDVPDGQPPAGKTAGYDAATGHDIKFGFGRANAGQAVRAAQGRPIQQLLRDEAGVPADVQDEILVTLTRRDGDRFVSEKLIELVDARRDPIQLSADDRLFVRGGPGGFLRAAFRPTGGGATMTDEVDVLGQPTL
jgi:hypothetical protein